MSVQESDPSPLHDERTVIGPAWLTGKAMKHVRLTAETGDVHRNAICISRVPLSIIWGQDDNKLRLCLDGQPSTFTFIGQFDRYNVQHGADEVPLLSVRVHLMRDCRDGLVNLYGRQNPNRPINFNTVTAFRPLYAIRPQFPPLLNGTYATLPQDMPKFSWNDLRRGDIVLLECTFDRKMLGTLWTARFNLKRMTVLSRAPAL